MPSFGRSYRFARVATARLGSEALRWSSILLACGLVALVSAASIDARASETDQFTLPPRPLDDLGSDLNATVLAILRAEVAKLNGRLSERARRDERRDVSDE